MTTSTRTPPMVGRRTPALPLTLPVTYRGRRVGVYRPLAFATSGEPTATAHLNIDTGHRAVDGKILDELLVAARKEGWQVYDFACPNRKTPIQLEYALRERQVALKDSRHTSWARWVKRGRNQVPRRATPILVAFTHREGELDPLTHSILVNGRVFGVHAVHLGPLDALPGAARAMLDLSVTKTPAGLALTQPVRTIPL